MDHARVRYLEAKRTVDDRALNERVRRRLLDAAPDDCRVFEAGCGTGANVPRLAEWDLDVGSYLGVDRDAGLVRFARELRPAELRRRGLDAVDTATGCRVDDRPFAFHAGNALRPGDALRAADSADPVDLVIAHAFMDLVPAEAAVAAFERVLAPGGLAYFPITFDGVTVFQPDHPADDAVERAYHDHVDAADGRDVRAGRHLAHHLQERDGTLLAMGASDWVVRPRGDGYPADEASFLATILGFVETALADADVDRGDEWLATRRRQLENRGLTYVAHQYDLLYRTPK
ncbi:class I SAM-dependent methyltransferase [Halobacteriaceae archaeon GCM10025711]